MLNVAPLGGKGWPLASISFPIPLSMFEPFSGSADPRWGSWNLEQFVPILAVELQHHHDLPPSALIILCTPFSQWVSTWRPHRDAIGPTFNSPGTSLTPPWFSFCGLRLCCSVLNCAPPGRLWRKSRSSGDNMDGSVYWDAQGHSFWSASSERFSNSNFPPLEWMPFSSESNYHSQCECAMENKNDWGCRNTRLSIRKYK